MKPVTGGLIGALVTALAVFGWNGRPAAREDGGWTGVTVPSPGVHLVSDVAQPALASQALAPAGAPLALTCEPGQRAVLRQVAGPNGIGTEAGCVTDTRGFAAAALAGFVSQGVIDPTAAQPVHYVTREPVPER